MSRLFAALCRRRLLHLCLLRGPDVYCVLTTTSTTSTSTTTTTSSTTRPTATYTTTTTSSTTTTTGPFGGAVQLEEPLLTSDDCGEPYPTQLYLSPTTLEETSPGVLEGYFQDPQVCPNREPPPRIGSLIGTLGKDFVWQAETSDCVVSPDDPCIKVSGTGFPGVVRNGKPQHSARGAVEFHWTAPNCTERWEGVWRPADLFPYVHDDPKELTDRCN